MISVRPYEASDRAAWDAFVNQSKTPMFMFDRGFMEYHADRFEDAVLFVLASEHYGESDYVRDYAEFRRLAKAACAGGADREHETKLDGFVYGAKREVYETSDGGC